nr:hypothetical protein CFP56_26110 [Quercus suber]
MIDTLVSSTPLMVEDLRVLLVEMAVLCEAAVNDLKTLCMIAKDHPSPDRSNVLACLSVTHSIQKSLISSCPFSEMHRICFVRRVMWIRGY